MNAKRWMCVALAMVIAVCTAQAQSGTWTNTAAGPFDWGTSGNWSGGMIADGADNTATFSSSLTANQIVNLDGNRTIGNITNSTSGNYTRTISGANTLTFDRTSGIPTIDVASSRTLTIGTPITGNDGLEKTGAGTLTLAGANSFSGGVFINGGAITLPSGATAANLGDSGNVVTFTGNSTLNLSTITLSQGFAINAGVTATLAAGYATVTLTNSLAGSGTLLCAGGGTSGGYFIFTSTNNPFSGNIKIYSYSSGSYPAGLTMVSLADSPGSRITLGSNNSTVFFNYGADAVAPLVLSNRQIEFYANYEFPSTLNNNATNVNCTVTVNTDLLVSRNSNITFGLGGSNTGNNTFAGAIPNKTGYVTSLAKSGTGKWILAGPNTYTGTTTISDGTLEFASSGTYAGNIAVTDTTPNPLTFSGTYTQTVSGVISGTMSLIKEGTGTLILTGANTHTNTLVNAGTLSLGDGSSSSSLYDFSTLSVASGAQVDLNFTGTDAVFYLNLGGSPAAKGEWGAVGSGAANESALITGTGRIDNLNGDSTGVNIAFWDGGSADIGTDGNAVSAGGAGTWNTATKNWDFGFVAHAAWPNTTAGTAMFGGTAGTVTLGSDITLGSLVIGDVNNYIIGGASETYTLTFGGAKTISFSGSVNAKNATIRTGIAGSPDFNIAMDNDNNAVFSLLPPAGVTMTLGTINMLNTYGSNKTLILGGAGTDNIVDKVTWTVTNNQLFLRKQASVNGVDATVWTINQNISVDDGKIYVEEGTLIFKGITNYVSHSFETQSGGRAVLQGNWRLGRKDEGLQVRSGGIVAPGSGVATVSFDWQGAAGTAANSEDYSVLFQNGSTNEWEVAPTATDTIHLAEGRLYLDTGMVLKVLDAGGTPKATDQLPVFTYAAGVTRTLGTVTIDTSALTGGWTGTPTLVDNGTGTIYLTGLQAPVAGTLIYFK